MTSNARKPHRTILPTLLLTLILLLVGGTSAAAAGSPFAALDERIDLSLEDATAQQVLTVFAQIFQAELKLNPGVEGEVTITLYNVTARTALNAVCEGLGCRWRLVAEGSPRLVVEPERSRSPKEDKAAASETPLTERPVTLETEKTPAVDVLLAITKLYGLTMQIDHGLEGTVTVSIRDRPLRDALDEICQQVDCRWTVITKTDTPYLRITPLSPG